MEKKNPIVRDVYDEEASLFGELLDWAPEGRQRIVDALIKYEKLLSSDGGKLPS